MTSEGDSLSPDTQQSAPNLTINAPQTSQDDGVSSASNVAPASIGASGEVVTTTTSAAEGRTPSDLTGSLSSLNAPQTKNDEDTAASGDRRQSNLDLTSLPSVSSSTHNSAAQPQPLSTVDSKATRQSSAATPLNAPQAGEDDSTTVLSGPKDTRDDDEHEIALPNISALLPSSPSNVNSPLVVPSSKIELQQQRQQRQISKESINSKSCSGTIADLPPTREINSYVDDNQMAPPLVAATPFQATAQSIQEVGVAAAPVSSTVAHSIGMKAPKHDQSPHPPKDMLHQNRLSPQLTQEKLNKVTSNSEAQNFKDEENTLRTGKGGTNVESKNEAAILDCRKPSPSAPRSSAMEAATGSSMHLNDDPHRMPHGGEQKTTSESAFSVSGNNSVGTERTKKTSNRTIPTTSTPRIEGTATVPQDSNLDDNYPWSNEAIHCVKNIVILILSVTVVVLAIAYARATGEVGNNGSDGDNNSNGPDGRTRGMLRLIQDRGVLRCGVPNEQPGFAVQNATTGEYRGMDVDLVRPSLLLMFDICLLKCLLFSSWFLTILNSVCNYTHSL